MVLRHSSVTSVFGSLSTSAQRHNRVRLHKKARGATRSVGRCRRRRGAPGDGTTFRFSELSTARAWNPELVARRRRRRARGSWPRRGGREYSPSSPIFGPGLTGAAPKHGQSSRPVVLTSPHGAYGQFADHIRGSKAGRTCPRQGPHQERNRHNNHQQDLVGSVLCLSIFDGFC